MYIKNTPTFDLHPLLNLMLLLYDFCVFCCKNQLLVQRRHTESAGMQNFPKICPDIISQTFHSSKVCFNNLLTYEAYNFYCIFFASKSSKKFICFSENQHKKLIGLQYKNMIMEVKFVAKKKIIKANKSF